ncbi:putative nuclease HARBI1 [Spodoptera litura]|uniref:Nuclease HARBI1 n=1 Tax=Spodoptera litura TaxID=69820 RepID=A0A9J7IPT2_SPOLT|nr:putative nuclease HARBI1 [Spodoptera litura]
MHTLRLLWAANTEEEWNRRNKRKLCRKNQYEEIPDNNFIDAFRLDKETFTLLCNDLRAHTSLRGTKHISLETKVLCTLSFLATGSYQRIVGVTQFLPQRTASRCIREVVEALNSDYMLNGIRFPQTQQERQALRQEFQRRFNLPGVVGCIDCTHVAIVKPARDEHLFFNRKGYHSLNVQMICDHNLKILNVNAKYGGATHDSFIWASSQVEPFMRELHRRGEQTWLLGDSGYPQRAWLMTPVLNAAAGSQEDIYTTRHIQARNCIERCFGVLKGRWRCLLNHRTLHYDPHVASKIVTACCVLHNLTVHARLPPPADVTEHHGDDDGVSVDVQIAHNSQTDIIHGRATLNALISRL